MGIKLFFISRIFGPGGLGHSDASPGAHVPESANNTFAFKLLKQLARDRPDANIFISPYSASTALQMVANGACGQTKTEMDEVLGSLSNAASKLIAQSLQSRNDYVILEIANSIWYRREITVNPKFLACNQEFFGATVTPLDYADPRSVEIINNWASEKTHGRITRIADGMIDPVFGRLLLANAVYFNGKWSDPFEPEATADRSFHLINGSKKDIPMMPKSRTFRYQRGKDYQAVRLPYKGGNLAMYIFLPDINSSPGKLLRIMDGDAWQRDTKPDFTDADGDLVLPKFKIEDTLELAQPLQQLGMKTAFDTKKANFSDISSEQLWISGVRQKTFVEVKEEGTEAAAVTALAVAGCISEGPPPKRFQMIVDHPFLFLIEDNQTGTILFMGLIYDPS